jgi:PAS domain S-box-containing protein
MNEPESSIDVAGRHDTRSPGWITRWSASALVPPLVAFIIARAFWPEGSPWTLFYPAMVISAWSGGLAAGVVSTAISAAFAFFLVSRPEHILLKGEPVEAASALLFVAVGIAVSMLHERVRRATSATERALMTASRVNKHLERAVAERLLFVALVENSSDFIGIATPEGFPTYVNPGGRRMVGLSSDVPLDDLHIADFHPADDRSIVHTTILPAVFEHGHWEGETWFRDWRTERAIPVWLTSFAIREPGSGKLLGMATITRDISALREAREELEAVNERWHSATMKLAEAQRVAHVGSWSYDIATGNVEWSEELFRIFGRDPSGPVPRIHGPEPIYTPESVRAIENAVAKMRHDGEPYELDLEVVRPDKSTRLISARGEPTKNEAGEVVRLTGTAQDVTALRRLQRLREEWMSVIAHDLRQPIGVISMSADLLPELHRGEVGESERDIIARIGNAAHGLSRMVKDMLDASRIEAHRLSLDRSWVEPAALVQGTIGGLEPVVANVQLNVSTDPDLPRVYADPGRIEQVLGNLISNAIKYGDKSLGVDVRVERVGDEVRISVINRGKGIPPDEARTLFNRFTRARHARTSKTEGLGLGLYIAKGLIEAHGGRIGCESVPNGETTFFFTLPTHALKESAAA